MLVTQTTVAPDGVSTATHVEVKTQSAFTSKINWVQVVTALVTAVTGVVTALNLPEGQAVAITGAAAGIGQLLTIILRTFYTTTVIQNSVPTVPTP